MKAPLCVIVSAALLAACSSPPDPRDVASPWVEEFVVPEEVSTTRVHLHPLSPEYNQLDYEAAQSSIEHLRTTLQWGSWPSPEATVEQNGKDLERHWSEWEAREAYAYTVLDPSETRCVGCVYLNPDPDEPRGLRMAYWVVASELENDLDAHLLASLLERIEASWPVDVVTIQHPEQNPRGIELLEAQGLHRIGDDPETHIYQWRRQPAP